MNNRVPTCFYDSLHGAQRQASGFCQGKPLTIAYMKNRRGRFAIDKDEWFVAAIVLIAICQFMQTCGG